MPVLLGCLAGLGLDRRFSTEPWLLLAGAALGFATGLASFVFTVLRLEKQDPHGKE